jgi:hypothetical protein
MKIIINFLFKMSLLIFIKYYYLRRFDHPVLHFFFIIFNFIHVDMGNDLNF